MRTIVGQVTERPMGPRQRKARVYVWPQGENVIENLKNRRSRPYHEWWRLLHPLFEEYGIDPQKVRWSQKAGCSCGCSPGFVDESGVLKGDLHVDLIVEDECPKCEACGQPVDWNESERLCFGCACDEELYREQVLFDQWVNDEIDRRRDDRMTW